MPQQSWKEVVRAALSQLPKQVKYGDIEKDTAINAGRLASFASTGYLATDDVKNLHDWLVTKGYLTIAGGPLLPETASEGPPSYEIRNLKPFGEIAALVKHLAGVLTNETFSDKTRITLARNNVEPLLTALDEYEKILAQREASKQDKAG